MDELAIYANVERPAGHSSTREREMQSAEKIYENMFLNTLEPNITGPAFSDVEEVKKSSCRVAAVVLGLLSLLLLAGVITLFFLFTKNNSELKMEMALLHNNRTGEKEQYQSSYNNLTEEKEHLQANYNRLRGEKEQLQSHYDDLTKKEKQLQTEREQLQKKLEALTKEKNDLQKNTDCQQMSG